MHVLLFYLRLSHKGKNEREEPKGIVFLSQLLLLFQHCHRCFSSKPDVSVTRSGTMLTLESKCKLCNETITWKSQPHLLGKFPAGNILLSFGILSAGASTTKVLRVFKHMGLLGYNEVTYYYHQRHLSFHQLFYTGVPIKKQFWIHEMVKKSFWLDMEGMIAWATQQNMVPIQFFVVQLG